MDTQGFQSGANVTDRFPTLRDIATPVFRRPKLVVVTFLIILAGTILGTLLIPKVYESEMKILVKRERVDAAVSPGRDAVMSNPGGVTEEELNSEVELLKSRDLLEKVVISCDLQELLPKRIWDRLLPAGASTENGDAQYGEKKASMAVLALESKLQIEPMKK